MISPPVLGRIAPMLGKNILAVYPHRRRSSEIRFAPPIGLAYVMAAVQDLVERITIVDMRLEEEYDLARFIEADTSSVCISLNWPPSKPENGGVPEFDLLNRLPAGLLTVVGGRWASLNTDVVFESCPHVDIVVQGDGEEPLRELAKVSSLADIEGLAYRADGVIHRNPPRRLAPLSQTLYPNRKLRRYDYTVAARGIDVDVTVDMVLSSHGCPFRCKFCAYNADWQGRRRPWQARTPESVLEELRTIDADAVFFADNNFCVDMDRVGAICDLVIQEGIRKTFALEARVDGNRQEAEGRRRELGRVERLEQARVPWANRNRAREQAVEVEGVHGGGRSRGVQRCSTGILSCWADSSSWGTSARTSTTCCG